MRKNFPEAEHGRIITGKYASPLGATYGAFSLFCLLTKKRLSIIVSDGQPWSEMGLPGPPWEHVSVSTNDRCPTWGEMCWIKSLFWEDEETVVQFHPPAPLAIDFHPFCLHLWRCPSVEQALPPERCV